jgi:hypothetical protein
MKGSVATRSASSRSGFLSFAFFEIVYKTAKRVSQERAINAIQSTSDVDDLGAFAGNDRSIGAGLHLPVHCS